MSQFVKRVAQVSKPFALDIETVALASQKFAAPLPSGKPSIVFLHGLCGNKKNNRASARVFSEQLQRDVYTLDLRNHGNSPHIERHDTAVMACDVERYILEKKLETPIIIGHSMGAKVAYAIALRRPEMPSAIIAVDNIPAENVKGELEFAKFAQRLEGLQKVVDEGCTTMAQADKVMSEVESDPKVRLFMLSNLARNKGERIYHSKVPCETLIKHLEDIRGWEFGNDQKWMGPTLLTKALKSPFVDSYKEFNKQFPNCEIVEMNTGHWIISDENKKFNKICIDFINKRL